jgi:hypothetical protein
VLNTSGQREKIILNRCKQRVKATFVRGVAVVCALIAMGGVWARGQAPPDTPPAESKEQEQGKELPNAPGTDKSGAEKSGAEQSGSEKPGTENPQEQEKTETEAAPSPVQVVEDKTKEIVSQTTDTAKTTLLKARDWESGWIAGIYVGKNRKLVPLTREERRDYYLHQTFTTPEAYMKRMFAALVDQARGVPYQWDDGWAGYAERFASREGQFFTSNSLAALGNAKLGYEVRYDKCKCSDFQHRLRHAIMRNFLTYDRSEVNLRPQWALYGGAFGGGLMVTAWKPGTRSPWANGAWAMLGQAGYGSLVNLITEFSTEINRKQGVGK